MNLSRFFCKHPLTSFCLGPSGLAELQPQPFTIEWYGEFVPTKGVYYKSSIDEIENFIPISGYSTANNFSFSFESGNLLWYCLSESGRVNLVKHSTQTTYSFSGNYGQICNNSIVALGKNDTVCIYEKNGAVFYRSSAQSFLTEVLIYSGESRYASLNQVYKTKPPTFYHLSVFGLDINKNGLELVLNKENPFKLEYFDNFNQYELGVIKSFNYPYLEKPATYFIDATSHYLYNDFSSLPVSGIYSGFIN